jgi:hypothetical protein
MHLMRCLRWRPALSYVYHLDNVEKNRRPSRPWEVGSQAIVTGLCGLVAAMVSFDLIPGAVMPIDRIILTAVYGAAVGFALGWYIPKTAGVKFDPPADREERVRTLEIEALAQFGNSTAATDWLDKPNPLLGQKSPRLPRPTSMGLNVQFVFCKARRS